VNDWILEDDVAIIPWIVGDEWKKIQTMKQQYVEKAEFGSGKKHVLSSLSDVMDKDEARAWSQHASV